MPAITRKGKNLFLFLSGFLLVLLSASAQCVLYPVSLDKRTSEAASIALGRVMKSTPFLGYGNDIYTLHKVQVSAWLKAASAQQELYLITPGGVLNDRATVVNPGVSLEGGGEYLFFLAPADLRLQNRQVKSLEPAVPQLELYAGQQGALTNRDNYYHDVFGPEVSETQLFAKIRTATNQEIRTPEGRRFQPRLAYPRLLKTSAITGFTPNPAIAGSIRAADRLKITGTDFGPTRGTVVFRNADNPATTLTASLESDYITWTDTYIEMKIPSRAGTGNFTVNGLASDVSPTPLTIRYALLTLEQSFSGFATPTRQLPRLVNKDGQGGYTFFYHTNFNAVPPAVTAFERSLSTWRCATGVNFKSDASGLNAEAVADGLNIVMFETPGTPLPAGTLGRTTTRYQAESNASCQQENTVWYINEIDMVFSEPPSSGATWQYGPPNAGATEYDFESVALHELGHAHNLGHVIDPGQVMHYAVGAGATQRTLNADDIAAGEDMMTYSTQPLCTTPFGVNGPMTEATCGTLPVTFLSFTGRKLAPQRNLLEWQTGSETNNKGFDVERSANGQQFTSLGFVDGKNSPASYTFQDARAGRGDWYYRLRQVDRDRRAKFSAVVFIKGGTDAIEVWSGGRTVFVQSGAAPLSAAIISLYAPDGRLLASRRLTSQLTEIEIPASFHGPLHYRVHSSKDVVSGRVFIE